MRIIIKDCVQGNSVHGWKDFCLQGSVGWGGGSNLGPLEGELKPRTARSVGQA